MSVDKDSNLREKIQTLIDLGVGDRGRLEHIKETIRFGNQLYNSDKIYLDKMLKAHSLTDTSETNEPSAFKSEESKIISSPQPQSNLNENPSQTPNQSQNSLIAPLGVRILSIISYIIGFLFLIIGVVALAMVPILIDMISASQIDISNNEMYKILYDVLVLGGIITFEIIFIVAITGILLGYGLARLKKWSWWLLVLSIILPTVFIPAESFIMESMSMSIFNEVIEPELLERLEDTEPESSESDALIDVAFLAPIYGIYLLVLWYMFKRRNYFGEIKTITRAKLSMVVVLVMAPSITMIILSYFLIRSMVEMLNYADSTGMI